MTLADANQGDVFRIGDSKYRCMFNIRGVWFCRKIEAVRRYISDHHTFPDDTEIDDWVFRQPQSGRRVAGSETETHQLGETKKEWYDV